MLQSKLLLPISDWTCGSQVIFYTKRFQVAPDRSKLVRIPPPLHPSLYLQPLLAERLLSSSLIPFSTPATFFPADLGRFTRFPSSARYAFTSHFCLIFRHTSSTHSHITCLVSMRVRFVEDVVLYFHMLEAGSARVSDLVACYFPTFVFMLF